MRWRKLGVIVPPGGASPWAATHASVPVCLPIDDRRTAILYSVRDAENRSLPARMVFNVSAMKAESAIEGPLLNVGRRGAFDDCGVLPTWAIPQDKGLLVYYVGWNRAVTTPFQNALGAAFSDAEGRNWQRVSEGPLIARSRRDPFFVASCAVSPFKSGWRMWYLSCREWFERDGALLHRYHIRQMDSPDALDWRGDSRPAIDFQDPDEYAISRPSVLFEGGRWHMWYSTRGARNRIGYAHSSDGETWVRRDDIAGIAAADSGWDSEMICYPHVFRLGGALFMAYNGNGYGASGVGLAILDGALG